jgi:hypothetical protein
MSKKKIPLKVASGKLQSPAKIRNGQDLVAITEAQIATIQQCADYPNQPAVQAATKTLQDDTALLDKTLGQIANTRSSITNLEATRDTQIVTVSRDRRHVEATITVVCNGNTNAIKAWGCLVQAKSVATASTDAPTDLTAKPSKTTPGTVIVQCRAVPGVMAYLFQINADQAAPPGAAPPVMSSKARYQLAGQPIGHTLYVRAAVVRRNGGLSQWSDVVQVTVR